MLPEVTWVPAAAGVLAESRHTRLELLGRSRARSCTILLRDSRILVGPSLAPPEPLLELKHKACESKDCLLETLLAKEACESRPAAFCSVERHEKVDEKLFEGVLSETPGEKDFEVPYKRFLDELCEKDEESFERTCDNLTPSLRNTRIRAEGPLPAPPEPLLESPNGRHSLKHLL